MNKEIQEKSQALHDWILEQEVVKEFQRYEVLIENHQELKELEEELKDLQKQIVRVKHENIDAELCYFSAELLLESNYKSWDVNMYTKRGFLIVPKTFPAVFSHSSILCVVTTPEA